MCSESQSLTHQPAFLSVPSALAVVSARPGVKYDGGGLGCLLVLLAKSHSIIQPTLRNSKLDDFVL